MHTDTERTWQAICEGLIPAWSGLLILLVAAIFVLLQLRRELRERTRREPVAMVVCLLRCAIVALLVWLLCKPALLLTEHRHAPPLLLLGVDGSRSMQTVETFAGRSERIDALSMLGMVEFDGRDQRGSQLLQQLRQLSKQLRTALPTLARQVSESATDLPVAPETQAVLAELAGALPAFQPAAEIARLGDAADEGTAGQSAAAVVAAAAGRLAAALQLAVDDCRVAAMEAQRRPQLIDGVVGRLTDLAAAATDLRQAALAWQDDLDAQSLSASQLAETEAVSPDRRRLGAAAAGRIERALAGVCSADKVNGAGLDALLEAVFARRCAGSVAAAVIVSDGARGDPARCRELADRLAAMQVPVSTVLVGDPEVTPADAALVSIDCPSLAVQGRELVVSALVFNRLPSGQACLLEAELDGKSIASLPVTGGGDDPLTVALPMTLPDAGLVQVQFALRLEAADAYAGNEVVTRQVYVAPAPIPVLLLSDRLTPDFPAYRSLLNGLGAVELFPVLATPGLTDLEFGADAGQLPGTIDEWLAYRLVVLIGGVPAIMTGEGGPHPSIVALRQAISKGLQIYLHEPPTVARSRAWSQLLELPPTRDVSAPAALPERDWLDLYQLQVDTGDSRALWRSFPVAPVRALAAAAGDLPLLVAAEGRAMARLGGIVFNGLSSFDSLRGWLSPDGLPTPPYLNRVIARSLAFSAGPPGAPAALAPVSRADFQLRADDTMLREIAERSGGRFLDLRQAAALSMQDFALQPSTTVYTKLHRFWRGWWPLAVLLLMVSAEYLLRRRLGRVM